MDQFGMMWQIFPTDNKCSLLSELLSLGASCVQLLGLFYNPYNPEAKFTTRSKIAKIYNLYNPGCNFSDRRQETAHVPLIPSSLRSSEMSDSDEESSDPEALLSLSSEEDDEKGNADPMDVELPASVTRIAREMLDGTRKVLISARPQPTRHGPEAAKKPSASKVNSLFNYGLSKPLALKEVATTKKERRVGPELVTPAVPYLLSRPRRSLCRDLDD
jgi:hypothetical protein